MRAQDIDAYADIVRRDYGEDALDFAKRMAARFAGSETEVELFWKTVVNSLARDRPPPESMADPLLSRRVTQSFSAIIGVAVRDLWAGWIADLGSRRRLATRATAY